MEAPMAEIKLYELCNDSDGGGTMEECEYGAYLLASDIDAEALESAIDSMKAHLQAFVAESAGLNGPNGSGRDKDRLYLKCKNLNKSITHLSALLRAIKP